MDKYKKTIATHKGKVKPVLRSLPIPDWEFEIGEKVQLLEIIKSPGSPKLEDCFGFVVAQPEPHSKQDEGMYKIAIPDQGLYLIHFSVIRALDLIHFSVVRVLKEDEQV